MFWTKLSDADVAKVATGEPIDYDTARDTLIADPDARIYAYVERCDSPHIARLHTPVKLSDLAPAIGFAWLGTGTVPVKQA